MKSQPRQLYALSMFHALNDGSLAVFLAALPIMHVALGLSLVEIGTILSAGLLATVVMQFVFGYLSDKGFTRGVLIAGLAAIAIMDLVFVKAMNYWQVLLFYVLLRAAAGVYHPVSFSTIFRTVSNRPAALGFQSAFGDASLAFAMFSTGFIAESVGWQIPFLIWGLSSIVGVVIFASLIGLRHQEPVVADPTENEISAEPTRGVSKQYVALQFSTAFLQSLYATFTGFIPLFLNIDLQLSPGISALVVALWLAVGVGATFNAGRLVDFFGGEKRTLLVTFGVTTFMLVAGAAMMLNTSLWLLALIPIVLSGFPFFLTFPVLYGIIGTTAPQSRLGLAYATNLSISLIGGSAVSYAAGYLSSIFGLSVILAILIACAIGASLTAYLI